MNNVPASVTSLSVTDCDKIALQHAGLIAEYFGTHYFTHAVGDWNVKVVGLHTPQPHLVLTACSKRASNLLKKGRIAVFQKEGLSYDQAVKLDRAEAKFKFELAARLPDILADGIDRLALSNHPQTVRGECTPQQARQWLDHWRECISFNDLSPGRVTELAKMVEALA